MQAPTKQMLLGIKIEFAKAAMEGMLSGEWAAKSNTDSAKTYQCEEFKDEKAIAHWAWKYADAMMGELAVEEDYKLFFPEDEL